MRYNLTSAQTFPAKQSAVQPNSDDGLEEAASIVQAAYQAHPAAMREVMRWWKTRKSQGADFIGVPVLSREMLSALKGLQILVPANPNRPNGRLTCNEQLWPVVEKLQLNGSPVRGQEDQVPMSVPPPSRPSAPSSRRSGRVQRDLLDPEQVTKADLRALARPGNTSLFDDGEDEITAVMHRDEIVAIHEMGQQAEQTNVTPQQIE